MSATRKSTVWVIAGLVTLGAGGTAWYTTHKSATGQSNVAQPVPTTLAGSASADSTASAAAPADGATPAESSAPDNSGAAGVYAMDDMTSLSTYPSLSGVVETRLVRASFSMGVSIVSKVEVLASMKFSDS